MTKQQAEHDIARSTTRCLEEKYRNVIEKLQNELKSSNSFFKKATPDLQAAFLKISNDVSKIFDDDFMFGIF